MILDIVKHPKPEILQQQCAAVVRDHLTTAETQAFIQSMMETMHNADGVGIAAPQVGTLDQMCIINSAAFTNDIKVHAGTLEHDVDLALVNPTWTRLSRRTAWDTEGCLSIPKTFGKVKRYVSIRVEAYDRHGKELVFDASQFFARVIQHEIDHLRGELFIEKAKGIYEID